MQSNKHYNLAIAGLGVVGGELLDFLIKHPQDNFTIKTISARTERNVANIAWTADTISLANDPEIDIIFELIGGDSGIAYDLVTTALKNGKIVITANKALLANHSAELFTLCTKHNSYLLFEAAIAGALPIVKYLTRNFKLETISEIYGILNGTCNFILSKISNDNLDFATALKLAQDEGFAESDPTLDIDGTDAAHKIALISALASNAQVDFKNISITGITDLAAISFSQAAKLGYEIKLLARSNLGQEITQYVAPFLVKASDEFAQINNSANSILLKTSHASTLRINGLGAGAKPTNSAVLSDLETVLAGNATNFIPNKQVNYAATNNLARRFFINFAEAADLAKFQNKLADLNLASDDIADEHAIFFNCSLAVQLQELTTDINYINLLEVYE